MSAPQLSMELAERLRILDEGRVVNPGRVIRAAAVAASASGQNTPWEILQGAAGKALGGGLAGAAAMAVQVSSMAAQDNDAMVC